MWIEDDHVFWALMLVLEPLLLLRLWSLLSLRWGWSSPTSLDFVPEVVMVQENWCVVRGGLWPRAWSVAAARRREVRTKSTSTSEKSILTAWHIVSYSALSPATCEVSRLGFLQRIINTIHVDDGCLQVTGRKPHQTSEQGFVISACDCGEAVSDPVAMLPIAILRIPVDIDELNIYIYNF